MGAKKDALATVAVMGAIPCATLFADVRVFRSAHPFSLLSANVVAQMGALIILATISEYGRAGGCVLILRLHLDLEYFPRTGSKR